MDAQHLVYRLYDGSGVLLYVGMTGRHYRERFDEHATSKKWWPYVVRYELAQFDDARAAAAAETAAIRTERPVFNVAQADQWASGRQRRYWQQHPGPAPRAGYMPDAERVARAYQRRYGTNTIPLSVTFPAFIRSLEVHRCTNSPSPRTRSPARNAAAPGTPCPPKTAP